MIWSWMRRCGVPVKVANEVGFIAHGRILLFNYEERLTFQSGKLGLSDLIARLAKSGYVHAFTVPPSAETVHCTIAMMANLKDTASTFGEWTAFLFETRDKAPNSHKMHVVFGFANEDDAVKARMSLQ